MQSVLSYFGSKGTYCDWIVSFYPPTKNYDVFVDVFGGSGIVIANSPQVDLLVFNDIDQELCNFMRVLRDYEDRLIRAIALTPYSADEIKSTFDVERREGFIKTDPVEAARLFYLRTASSFAGYKGGGPRGWARAVSGKNSHILSFNNLDKLYEFAKIVKNWQIEGDTYANILDRYQNDRTLFYLDPPYLASACADGREDTYRFDLKSDEDHIELIRTVLDKKGYFLLSGYDSELYNDMLIGWGKELKGAYTVTRSLDDDGEYVNEYAERTETLWLSPNVVRALSRPMQVSLFSLEVA